MDNLDSNKGLIEIYLEEKRGQLTNMLPKRFREEFLEKSYIAGGCIYSLYNLQVPKDYDFFLTDNKLIKELREFFETTLIGTHRENLVIGYYGGKKVIITDKAISIDKFQIVTKWYGEPQDVVSQFDFFHNMFYYVNEKIYTLSDFKYLNDNNLYYNTDRARDICSTIIRVNKFVERGMKMTNHEMTKILLKLNKVGFNDDEISSMKNNVDTFVGS